MNNVIDIEFIEYLENRTYKFLEDDVRIVDDCTEDYDTNGFDTDDINNLLFGIFNDLKNKLKE